MEGSYTSMPPMYPYDVFRDILPFLHLQKLPVFTAVAKFQIRALLSSSRSLIPNKS
jgi:hypothetical protein